MRDLSYSPTGGVSLRLSLLHVSIALLLYRSTPAVLLELDPVSSRSFRTVVIAPFFSRCHPSQWVTFLSFYSFDFRISGPRWTSFTVLARYALTSVSGSLAYPVHVCMFLFLHFSLFPDPLIPAAPDVVTSGSPYSLILSLPVRSYSCELGIA